MISNRLSSSIIRPKTILQGTAKAVQGADMMTRFLKNKTVGKICETAADNPVICQSLFSLAICCGARPVTNYITTPDKKDAAYASCHSISSGIMGFVWPLIIATPLAAGVAAVLKKPQKFLKPEVIKKFYPNVGIEEVIKDGKKVKRVMTNTAGKLLRQDGTELCKELEPLKINNGDAKAKIEEIVKKLKKTKKASKIEKLNAQKAELETKHAAYEIEKAEFEAANPNLYVDKNGVVRSREVFKTKNGKYQLDDKGDKSASGIINDKIGCVVQKDKVPVTEEMELGINKEQNVKSLINWIPDILLAPPRAMLTIQLIPWLLDKFGMEKKKKCPHCEQQAQPQYVYQPVPARPPFAGLQSHIAARKGGV